MRASASAQCAGITRALGSRELPRPLPLRPPPAAARRRDVHLPRRAGKTLQTIAFLAHLKFNLGVCGPHLVLCPLSVLSSWLTEFKRFCPELRVVKLHSSDAFERERLKASILNDANLFDVVVTTYEMAKSPNMQSVLAHRRWWRYLVIDEGHVIKNEHSQISMAVRSFHCGGALLLTGTPLQNNMHELWALLNFLFPDIFPDATAFDSAFKLNSGSHADTVDSAKLTRAHDLLQPLMLRRVKTDVEKGLPDKLETTIECPLSKMQLFWCARARSWLARLAFAPACLGPLSPPRPRAPALLSPPPPLARAAQVQAAAA